ncbi:MAG: 5-deoxy-glucuronate isomerase [Acidobacteria bacterium]|nr:MAG: 5-deoxy-glucuronate isomerase [Acidobacteriota bacterium]
MERHIKAMADGKYQQIIAPGTMRYLDFARARLKSGETQPGATGDHEYVLDIFSGTVTISVLSGQSGKQVYEKVGGRADVFSGPPVMVYIPVNSTFEIAATSDAADIGIFSAPSGSATAPRLLQGADVTVNHPGRENWQRTVYSALDLNTKAERLLAGETLNPSGNWSSYPPHKHDRKNPPNEAVLEEVYFFRIKPSQGFGFIWTYTEPGDPEGFSTVFVVRDGDTVLLPKGYHPVVAAPGYQLHYTWVLAGEERRYGAWSDQPEHAWVKQQ